MAKQNKSNFSRTQSPKNSDKKKYPSAAETKKQPKENVKLSQAKTNIEIESEPPEELIHEAPALTWREAILKYPIPIIIVIAALVYFQTLFFSYIMLDDSLLLVEMFNKISDFSNIGKIFFGGYLEGFHYRPLITLSFMLDSQLAGQVWSMFHLTNIVIHCAVSSLVFILLNKLKYEREISFIAALIFAVHPLLTSNIAWLVGRNDTLAALFGLMSFVFLIDYLEKNKPQYAILHAFGLLFAVLSKEVALVLPALFLLYRLLFYKEKIINIKNIVLILIWLLPLLIWAIIKQINIESGVVPTDFSLNYFLINLRVIPETLSKIFLPFGIMTLPTFNSFETITGSIIIILLITFTLLKWKSIDRNKVIFAAVWFILLTIPGLFIRLGLADRYYDYLDCRAYLPIFGILVMLIEILNLKKLKLDNILQTSIVSAIVIFLSIITILQSHKYFDAETFWLDAVKAHPDKVEVHKSKVAVYLKNQQYEKAKEALDAAEPLFVKYAKYYPQHSAVYTNIGMKFLDSARYNMAAGCFEKAIQHNPDNEEAYSNLARTLFSIGKTKDAITILEKMLEKNPDSEAALNNLLTVCVQTKEYDKAEHYADILINKGFKSENIVNLYNMRAYDYFSRGNIKKSIELMEKLLSLYPNNSMALTDLGFYYSNIGNFTRAVELTKKAVEIDRTNAAAYKNLFLYYYNNLKQFEQAAYYADEYIKNGGKLETNIVEYLKQYKK